MLAGEFAEATGRDAYLAAYHAALAYILVRTGQHPKTHRGTRSEFARLAREDAAIASAHVAFLGFAYDLKELADYDELAFQSLENAKRALIDATTMVNDIATVIAEAEIS